MIIGIGQHAHRGLPIDTQKPRETSCKMLDASSKAIYHLVIYHFFIHFVHTICFAVWIILVASDDSGSHDAIAQPPIAGVG